MGIAQIYQQDHDTLLSVDCNVLRAASLDTWQRIGFSRVIPRLKIHETTITQNLVYEINLLRASAGHTISIFESTDERATGRDMEICSRQSNGDYLKFPTQAKILYHLFRARKNIRLDDGTYPQFEHYVGKGAAQRNQIDILLSHAKKNGQIPLYLLYNYVKTDRDLQRVKCMVRHGVSQYVCSVVSAQYLKINHRLRNQNLSPKIKFSDLHPAVAQPWFVLACCWSGMNIEEISKELHIDVPEYPIQTYSSQIILKDLKWKQTEDLSKAETIVFRTRETNDNLFFNPLFRFVIG